MNPTCRRENQRGFRRNSFALRDLVTSECCKPICISNRKHANKSEPSVRLDFLASSFASQRGSPLRRRNARIIAGTFAGSFAGRATAISSRNIFQELRIGKLSARVLETRVASRKNTLGETLTGARLRGIITNFRWFPSLRAGTTLLRDNSVPTIRVTST